MTDTPHASVFKILTRAAWNAATDTVPWAAIDRTDGFVHLSAAHQVEQTARLHFSDRDGLVLVEILTDRLAPGTLRWEVSRGGEAFPHVYGDIPMAAVRRTAPLSTRPGATFPTHLLEG